MSSVAPGGGPLERAPRQPATGDSGERFGLARALPLAHDAACRGTILCADWSGDPAKRDVYVASVADQSVRRLGRPPWTLSRLLGAARELVRPGCWVLLGLDVPLGIPAGLVAHSPAGQDPRATFLDWLAASAQSGPRFFEGGNDPALWSPLRPFFRVAPGEGQLKQWFNAMRALGVDPLRSIDTRTRAKCMFIRAGLPGTVGSAAADVWAVIAETISEGSYRVWPFDGPLATLCGDEGVVVGEIYPRIAYGIALGPENLKQRSRLLIAKTKEAARSAALDDLQGQRWVTNIRLNDVDAALVSEDAFDALITAAALLRCVIEGTPIEDSGVHRFEGGMLGAGSLNLDIPEHTLRPAISGSSQAPAGPSIASGGGERHDYQCPIPGCTKVFVGSRSGWDAHVAAARFHPSWHWEIVDEHERKQRFRAAFPEFFLDLPSR